MQLTVSHTDLAAAVAHAAASLPNRPPVPVLAGLKLTARDGQLAVTGYDYDVSTTATTAADVATAGTALVSGRLLTDITRALRRDVQLDLVHTHVSMTSGSAKFTLNTLPLEEYPSVPATPGITGTASGKEFADALAQVAVAAGTDDTLPVLTGIQITLADDALTLAATDRYRIAVRSLEWEALTTGRSGHTLIPAKALARAAKALADTDQVSFGLPGEAGGILGITGEHYGTTIRSLDGALPDPTPFVTIEPATVITADTHALADAVKRVALVADRGQPVRLALAEGEITLTAGAADDALAVDRVTARLEGDPLSIAFNPSFLLDGLGALGAGTTTRIAITTPTKPALITADGSPETALRYVLMPVRLSG